MSEERESYLVFQIPSEETENKIIILHPVDKNGADESSDRIFQLGKLLNAPITVGKSIQLGAGDTGCVKKIIQKKNGTYLLETERDLRIIKMNEEIAKETIEKATYWYSLDPSTAVNLLEDSKALAWEDFWLKVTEPIIYAQIKKALSIPDMENREEELQIYLKRVTDKLEENPYFFDHLLSESKKSI